MHVSWFLQHYKKRITRSLTIAKHRAITGARTTFSCHHNYLSSSTGKRSSSIKPSLDNTLANSFDNLKTFWQNNSSVTLSTTFGELNFRIPIKVDISDREFHPNWQPVGAPSLPLVIGVEPGKATGFLVEPTRCQYFSWAWETWSLAHRKRKIFSALEMVG